MQVKSKVSILAHDSCITLLKCLLLHVRLFYMSTALLYNRKVPSPPCQDIASIENIMLTISVGVYSTNESMSASSICCNIFVMLYYSVTMNIILFGKELSIYTLKMHVFRFQICVKTSKGCASATSASCKNIWPPSISVLMLQLDLHAILS